MGIRKKQKENQEANQRRGIKNIVKDHTEKGATRAFTNKAIDKFIKKTGGKMPPPAKKKGKK